MKSPVSRSPAAAAALAVSLGLAQGCQEKPADLAPQPLIGRDAGPADAGSVSPVSPLPAAGPQPAAGGSTELAGEGLAALQRTLDDTLGKTFSKLAVDHGGETAGPLRFTLRYSATGRMEEATLDTPLPAYQEYVDAAALELRALAGPPLGKPYVAKVKVEAAFAYRMKVPSYPRFRPIQIIRGTEARDGGLAAPAGK